MIMDGNKQGFIAFSKLSTLLHEVTSKYESYFYWTICLHSE